MALKIKIGLKLDNFKIEFWLYKLIERLLSKEYIEIEFIYVNGKKASKKDFGNKLLNSYVKWDQSFFQNSKNAFDLRNLQELTKFKNIPVIKDFKKTISKCVNFILDFTSQGVNKDDLSISINATWSLRFGSFNLEKKGLELFWEVYHKKLTSDSMLISYSSDNPDGKIIYKSRSNTKTLSFHENRNSNYFKTSTFILRRLEQISLFGFDFLENIGNTSQITLEEKYKPFEPTNKQMIIFHLKLFFRELQQLFRKQFFNQEWEILFKKNNSINKINSVDGRWYADPFPIKKDGTLFLFFEDYIKSEHKGCISYVELKGNKVSKPVEVLKEKFHLSYPHIFKHENKYYMIPETLGDHSIRLYEATEFPKKWELKKKLIDNVKAVDSTIFFHKKKVWLFANIAKDGASDWEELYLFYSEKLCGKWISHPLNPVVSDVTRSRPAGNIFINKKGEIIRPSQDCSKCYGYATNINIIKKITTNEYEEVVREKILPKSLGNFFGTHTFNLTDNFYFYDVKKWRKNKNYNILKFIKNIFGIYHHKPIRLYLLSILMGKN